VVGGYFGSSGALAVDAFVARYGADGSQNWIERWPGIQPSMLGPFVVVDGSDNVFVLAGTATGADIGSAKIPGAGFFLVKLDPDGTVLWTKAPRGPVGAAAGTSV